MQYPVIAVQRPCTMVIVPLTVLTAALGLEPLYHCVPKSSALLMVYLFNRTGVHQGCYYRRITRDGEKLAPHSDWPDFLI